MNNVNSLPPFYYAILKKFNINTDNQADIELFIIENMKISTSYYKKIFLLENTLKYSINAILDNTFKQNWVEVYKDDIYFSKIIENELKNYNEFGLNYSILDKSAFGFWIELFNRESYKRLKGVPIKIFKFKPNHINRKLLYQKLLRIKEFRNYIYHNNFPLTIKSNLSESKLALEEIDCDIKDIFIWVGIQNFLPHTLK